MYSGDKFYTASFVFNPKKLGAAHGSDTAVTLIRVEWTLPSLCLTSARVFE